MIKHKFTKFLTPSNLFGLVFFVVLFGFFGSHAKADCAWFVNKACGGVNSCKTADRESYCSASKPESSNPVECCCCGEIIACCEKTNKVTKVKTTMNSTVAQCYANSYWADVVWYTGRHASNNDCVVDKPGSDSSKPGTDSSRPGTDSSSPGTDQSAPASAGTRSGITLPNPLGSQSMTVGDIPTIIGRVINALLGVLGAIALLVIIYGGFLWMTSAGNDSQVAKGRLTIMWAAIAIGIIFLSWILVAFFFQALGV